jgi:catechol 2,3-dioxygenase-like lactoylglutathione lyase family enzyme
MDSIGGNLSDRNTRGQAGRHVRHFFRWSWWPMFLRKEPAMPNRDLTALATKRVRLRATYLRTGAVRPPTTTRGLPHVALRCATVEWTIPFYQDLLEFPLTEVFENRDFKGSTHFFFDIGHGNTIAIQPVRAFPPVAPSPAPPPVIAGVTSGECRGPQWLRAGRANPHRQLPFQSAPSVTRLSSRDPV